MKTIDYSYFIERYNAGEMSESEKQWFQKELDGNEKLRKEVILRKQTDNILKEQNIISLRNKLSEIEKGQLSDKPAKKQNMPAYIKYAAVIAALVIIGSITVFSDKKLSNNEIINRYYKVYETSASQRSVNAQSDPDFNLALEFYNSKDYKKAAILFNTAIEKNPEDVHSVLLNGVSNFEIKKFPEAKQSYVRVISDNDNLYIETAKWYMALCYIQTNENAKAIQQLTAIKMENGIYSRNAGKILRKLKY